MNDFNLDKISLNVSLLVGSNSQHIFISVNKITGNFVGHSGRFKCPPSHTNFITSSCDKPGYGKEANVAISHNTTPYDQTSDLVVKYADDKVSGAIQRTGKRACPIFL